MSIDRTARGIVLVPCLLLGGAFLSAAAWGPVEAGPNRPLALAIGLALVLGGGTGPADRPGAPPGSRAQRGAAAGALTAPLPPAAGCCISSKKAWVG